MPCPPFWISNGLIVTQNSSRQMFKGHLRIENGRIESISRKPLKKRSRSEAVIDAAGLAILPGFVQAHVHLCQTLFRNQADDLELLDWLSKRIWKLESLHTAETVKVSAQLGIYELLSSGTTCVLDMGTVRHTEEIFKAVRESGIRANVGKCLMDHPATTPKGLREPTEAAIQEAVTLFKKWNGTESDRIRASFAPRFVVSCTEKLLREVGRVAKLEKALIHTHASENLKEIQLVKKLVNCENVEYLHQLGLTSPSLILAHCIWLKPNEKSILKSTGTHVVHCPSSNLKLASGIAHVPDLRARGINVALGADGAPCNNNLNLFNEMRLAALIHKPGAGPKAMRAQEVLDMATRDGAKALHWFSDIGSIEVGKKADLIALGLGEVENLVPASALGKNIDTDAVASSIVYASQSSHLRWTMVDGKVLYRNGRVLTVSREKILTRARAAQLWMARKVDF